jgi:hypothetical protein
LAIYQWKRQAGVEDRSLQTRQLDLLNDWLEAPRWEIYQAACLLTGVLPPERDSGNNYEVHGRFGGWLPGQKPWQDYREAWEFGVRETIAHIENLLRDENRIADRTPEGFLKLALRLKIVPPWAEVFVSSGKQLKEDNFRLRATLRDMLDLPGEENTRGNASYASRALDWAEAVETAAEFFGTEMTGEAIAGVLNTEGFFSGKNGDERYGAATIRGWRRKIMGQPKRGIPAISVKQFTAPFREWRDRVKR